MDHDLKKQTDKSLAKISDYKATFLEGRGQKVLHDMMRAHFMMATTYVKGDPYESAMREGERQVIIRILSILKVDLKKLEKHIKEADENDDH